MFVHVPERFGTHPEFVACQFPGKIYNNAITLESRERRVFLDSSVAATAKAG